MRRAQAGSASMLALVLLTVLAAAAGGAAAVLQASLGYLRSSEAADLTRRALESGAERVLAALASDPTPTSDSPLDPVWSLLAAPATGGVILGLADVSSALDPNWVQKNLLTRTGLRSLLDSPESADVLQQRREDRGFSLDIRAAYGDLFAEGALERYGTAYGSVNVNVTDEFALRRLYALRTGDAMGAEAFHGRVQALLGERRLLRAEELPAFLGTGYAALASIVNVEPCMNVHFLDPLILSELLAYPALSVPRPRESARAILAARDRSELSLADVAEMTAAPADSRIYQYLGVVTWFWRITAAMEGARIELIAARLPGAREGSDRFLVVERRYLRS